MLLFQKYGFQSMEAFQKGQEYHGSEIWQKYGEFDINILDFSDTWMHLLHLSIKKYMISINQSVLKPGWVRTNALEI